MITSAELALLRASDPHPLTGIDTPAGNPLSASSLKSYTTLTTNTKAPVYYIPSQNRVVVNGNGVVLSGYDFSGASVSVYGSNVTIKDSTFNSMVGTTTVQQMNTGATGLTVENCTFMGGKDDCNATYGVFSGPGYVAVLNNSFIDSPSHPVTLSNGVVSGNYFSGGAYIPGTHADAINVYGTTGPVTITNNFIDFTNNADAPMYPNNAIRISTDNGDTSNVTVTDNVLLGGQNTIGAYETTTSYLVPGAAGVVGTKGTFSNVNISGNYIGFAAAGAFYAGDSPNVSVSGNAVFDYTNPAYSTSAWAAYLAHGVGTTHLLTSTGNNLTSNPAGSTTLYGAGISGVHLIGSANETVYIGGAGTQYMWGGSGKDIFKYLSPADSIAIHPDVIGNFDPSNDVIDFSAMDADPAHAGVQQFTFIGTAPFSGSAGQVRYQYNAAKNQTLVEAELVGDSVVGANANPDIEIILSGNVPLTAANFALTAAVSGGTATESPAAPAVPASPASPAAPAVPASPAAPAGTTYTLTSTGNNLTSNPAGSTTLNGSGFSGVHLTGSTNETVFIGGAGTQYMWGGAGANIYTYLSPGDSPVAHSDSIGNFDSAKDVIDLSAIDADPAQAGAQSFAFIGTAPFSGSAGQVRYQYNPTLNQTVVDADLVGHSLANATPDFEVRLAGNVTLTAANFALTAAQSSADLAAGAALKMTVVGASKTPSESVYSNVQNRPYSSFAEIFPASSGVMAAEAFDNTDGTGSLTLSGANVTYAAAGSGQSVTVGGTAFSIAAHVAETINATGTNDGFVFKNGFGQDTLNGSGASDTLQLQKSMFSYLDPSASQSADLAAVLAHATSGAGGVTLASTGGDCLTLTGFTPAMLAAAPAGQITFV